MPCLWMVRHQPIFISFELLIITIIGHRVWLPPFHWRLGATEASDKPANLLIQSANLSTGSLDKVEKLMMAGGKDRVAMSDEQITELFHGQRNLEEVAPYLHPRILTPTCHPRSPLCVVIMQPYRPLPLPRETQPDVAPIPTMYPIYTHAHPQPNATQHSCSQISTSQQTSRRATTVRLVSEESTPRPTLRQYMSPHLRGAYSTTVQPAKPI